MHWHVVQAIIHPIQTEFALVLMEVVLICHHHLLLPVVVIQAADLHVATAKLVLEFVLRTQCLYVQADIISRIVPAAH